MNDWSEFENLSDITEDAIRDFHASRPTPPSPNYVRHDEEGERFTAYEIWCKGVNKLEEMEL